ncbi:MAG TPA: tetratricopeptide repeat protein [Elusimicrobiota bacterium]|jgi:tetratricopeptide (TPR) repeat protein|nr:tetratricopeptide repeat protein [Elusimicrobiota bacterium]
MPPRAALERFKPFLRLEETPRPPLRICGLLETLACLERPDPGSDVWFERSLPVKFRLSFANVPGLEPYAVSFADSLPREFASRNWVRLSGWKKEFPSLDARRRIVLLKLLGMLGLYWDNEELFRKSPPPRGGEGEEAAEYAFLRLSNTQMLFEPQIADGFAGMLEVARLAPGGARIRLVAALRFMTFNLERGVADGRVRAADRIARETLARLKRTEPPDRAEIHESKYRRTASFFPFLKKDYAGAHEALALSERSARRALEKAGPGALAFARENLYAVLATRVVVDSRAGRHAAALAWADEMVALDPEGSWQRLSRGMALFELGELDRARAELEECLRLAPPCHDEARLWLSRCLRRQGRLEEAGLREKEAAEAEARMRRLVNEALTEGGRRVPKEAPR